MDWIDVKDKLPLTAGYEQCKRYLIFDRQVEFAYWYHDEWRSDDIGPWQTYDPSHWMPLPPPPSK